MTYFILQVTNKLAGACAATAAWATHVGNEFGQVLQCVLTVAEVDGISDMTAGLVRRYERGRQSPSEVIYVDRDCCSVSGKSKVMDLFPQWKDLHVWLDIWHLCADLPLAVRRIRTSYVPSSCRTSQKQFSCVIQRILQLFIRRSVRRCHIRE